jgi:predicted ATPase
VVGLLGEPGLGKSRLIEELLRAERTHPPSTVLQAPARPGDAGVPYATLAHLLRQGLAGRAAVLDAPRRQQLARVLPERGLVMPLPANGRRLMLQAAVQQVLAQAGVALAALDDLHFADDASVQMLGVLIGASAPGPQRWLLAQRPAEGGSASRMLRDALQDDHAVTPLPLAPLDEAAMAELVDSLGLPGLDGRALAAELVRHTGGNPLHARAIRSNWRSTKGTAPSGSSKKAHGLTGESSPSLRRRSARAMGSSRRQRQLSVCAGVDGGTACTRLP